MSNELKAKIYDLTEENKALREALQEAHDTLAKVAGKVGVEPSESGGVGEFFSGGDGGFSGGGFGGGGGGSW